MPGLFGVIQLDPNTPDDASEIHGVLQEMGQRLRHVGTETVEFWKDGAHGVTLGRIDQPHLRSLRWPASPCPDGTWLFLDGFLQHHGLSDRQYRARFGELDLDGLKRLRGHFTLVASTPGEKRRVLLATDRRASRPLFYVEVGGLLIFAPEVKALLAVPGLKRELDPAAAALLLTSGFVLGSQTLLRGVQRLPGGGYLAVEEGRVRQGSYWDYELSVEGDGTPLDELEAELAHAIRLAVQRDYRDPDHDLIFLSGGLDSRAILAAVSRARGVDPKQIRAVSWGTENVTAYEDDLSDVGVARRLADHLDLDHRFVPRRLDDYGSKWTELAYLLDGASDVPAFHAYEFDLMRQLASEGIRRVLRGDECFGWRRRMRDAEEALLEVELRPFSAPRRWRGLMHPAVHAEFCQASEQALDQAIPDIHRTPPDNLKDQAYFRHRLQSYLNSAGYFKQTLLEHRTPLVAEELLDLIGRIPVEERCDKALYSRAMADAFPELWKVPIAERNNLENYAALLGTDSPLRRAVEVELADAKSGFWELFDRQALVDRLATLRVEESSSEHPSFTSRARRMLQRAASKVPMIERRVRSSYRRRVNRPEELYLRLVVLKMGFDFLVEGDGGREVMERKRAMHLES